MPKSYRSIAAKPFLRWIGGKQKLIGNLIEKLPDPATYQRYFEPFLGAGSLFLACGFKNAVLNDLNAPLINAYQQVKDRPELVHALLQEHQNRYHAAVANATSQPAFHILDRLATGGEWYYYQVRNAFNEALPDATPEQAARFIFLIHTNYNGVWRVNKLGYYNTPYGQKAPRIPSLDELQRVSCRLRGAKLKTGYCYELQDDIGQGDFVYLDPPYPVISKTAKFTNYTIDRFDEKEHRELAAFAKELHARGAKIMISISGTPLVRELYPRGRPWRYYSTDLKRTISSKNPPLVVQELILTNYKPYGILDLE